MKFAAPLLVVIVLVCAGCGSTAKPSAFCQSVSAVKSDVQNLKSLKSNPSLSSIQTDLKKLNTDVQKAISTAKSSAAPKVAPLKSSIKTLTATLTQVKDKKLTVRQAVPTLKTQAQAVSSAWKALTNVEKC